MTRAVQHPLFNDGSCTGAMVDGTRVRAPVGGPALLNRLSQRTVQACPERNCLGNNLGPITRVDRRVVVTVKDDCRY